MSQQSPPELPLLAAGARAIGLDLDGEQLRRFALLSRELREWNERVNLTSVTDPSEIEVKHFLDSLTLAPLVQQQAHGTGRLVDIGSGAGFPGLPLAIAFPWLRVSLMEATAKKVHFLRHVVQELRLTNVDAMHGRAEALAREADHREAYDLAAARAIGNTATLVELLTPFLRVGGLAILMKTRAAAASEINDAAGALQRLWAVVEEIRDVDVPGLTDRALVVIRKHRVTPTDFPRRSGVPARRPLTG